jgi:5-methylcytosine-specific restriction endonuclease McrA
VTEEINASLVSESGSDTIEKEFVEDGDHANVTDVPVDRAHEKDVKGNDIDVRKDNARDAVPTDITGRLTASAQKNLSVTVGKLVTLRVEPQRQPIAAALLHQVNLRDQQRCTHHFPDGGRCNQSRWLEIHHRTPVSEGGENTFENLTTLCSAHHRFMHLK